MKEVILKIRNIILVLLAFFFAICCISMIGEDNLVAFIFGCFVFMCLYFPLKSVPKKEIKPKEPKEKKVKEPKQLSEKQILKNKINDFPTKISINTFDKLYINDNTKEWYYKNKNNKIFNYNDVIKVDIIEDNSTQTITKTKGKEKGKKGISITKGIIGGAVAGPIGAVIGGSQGKTKTKSNSSSVSQDVEYCSNLTIIVYMNDINNPTITIPIISLKTKKDTIMYKNAINTANNILSVFNIMINSQDE